MEDRAGAFDEVWEQLAPRLVTVVRPAIYDGPFVAPLVRTPVAPFLYLYAAVDEDEMLRFLRADEVGSFPFGHREIVACGLRNAGARPPVVTRGREGASILVLEHDDGLAPSHLFVPGWLASLREEGAAPPVCVVPTSTSCSVSTSKDVGILEALLEQAEAAWGSGEAPLSPVPYTLDDEGAIVPLRLEAEHPLAPRLAHLGALFAAHEYERQREALEAGIAEAHEDLAVAACRTIADPTGGSRTVTTFAEGEPSLLPETELVCVTWQAGDAAAYALVLWEDFQEIAAAHLHRLDDHEPPRIATIGFPDAERRAQLEARAIVRGSAAHRL
ncbi:MAG: hypothetical protein HOW73_22205 [Polyangiaceae bacterium]|nr:hypothetical protein [Polyangiaceae bacterium]